MKKEEKRNIYIDFLRDVLVMCSPTVLGIVWDEGSRYYKEWQKKQKRKKATKKAVKKIKK